MRWIASVNAFFAERKTRIHKNEGSSRASASCAAWKKREVNACPRVGGVFHGPLQKRSSEFTTDFPSYSLSLSLSPLPVLREPGRTLRCRDARRGKTKGKRKLGRSEKFFNGPSRPSPLFMRREARECGNGCGNFAAKCNFSVFRVFRTYRI